jgi:hypothetical protein
MEIALTNLLYLKDEVIAAFITSLLNKNECAIFWAYELHYSGFNEELFELLEKVYYYFFATLNPNFKPFLNRKITEWQKTANIQIINSIVSNLLIRPFNLDIFMLVQTCKAIKMPPNFDGDLDALLAAKKYATVAKYALHICSESDIGAAKSRLEYLAQIMQKVTAQNVSISGHKLYLTDEYEPLDIGETPVPYKILENFCKYSVNNSGLLGAFQLNRPADFQQEWLNNWLYYASCSPIWLDRIESHNGIRDDEKHTILFESEDHEEAFYNQFGLEPDEQKRETQQIIIPQIPQLKVAEFYDKLKGTNGIYNVTKNALEKLKCLVI